MKDGIQIDKRLQGGLKNDFASHYKVILCRLQLVMMYHMERKKKVKVGND